ncbi:polyprenyl synthetase family protein [Streptomyces johnsoniae]|uniref:Polyprenyl synthetase family protein n=1 Tax=Streptomyces johnsoniae TaxID=3075532 RepID=A0ABU2S9C7_9ACTN|nr:polyprenyl synthetase family protein [Streptomyces sp. DSM 41886]MDT0444255.1 polyprenyl synthetase family protein [Streptomyces sp. DSM 41886]
MVPASASLVEQISSAQQTLRRCRGIVRPALMATIDRLPPSTHQLALYACNGGASGATEEGSGGKGVRQAFAVLAGEAVGGRAESAIPAAVAAELIHNFSLIHDDIIDKDEWRRHRPAVWKAFGTGPAVLAGDALLALAVEVVSTSAGDRCPQALRLLCTALSGLMRGQAQDLQFEDRPWQGPDAVVPEEYWLMVAGKTGALFAGAAALGALLAGGEPRMVEAFATAGQEFGMAFQTIDDALGIWGDPRKTGKPVGSDLRRRKKTLPVLVTLARGDAPARRLASLLETETEFDEQNTAAATALIEEAGGRDLVMAEGQRALGRAHQALADVPLLPRTWMELTALSEYLVSRTS